MNMNKPLSDAALKQIFTGARTHNGWSDRPVDEATIRAVYDLAKWGPTASNSTPARFVWARSVEAREKLAACASGSNATKIRVAPVTVIIGRDSAFADHMELLYPIKPMMAQLYRTMPDLADATAVRNTTLQGAYLIIAARSIGLDCGPMSGFDHAKVDEAFFAGTSIRSDFICSMGYGSGENMPERQPRLDFETVNWLR